MTDLCPPAQSDLRCPDTGSSDLWVVTDACTASTCSFSAGLTPYSLANFQPTGQDFIVQYLDQNSASGPIGTDSVSLAGLTLQGQYFGAANVSDATSSSSGLAGLLGLGFPCNSNLWSISSQAMSPADIIPSFATMGPFVSRLILSNFLAEPMITITFQRDQIDRNGNAGILSIGELPEGVRNETLTWVPLRMEDPTQLGFSPPADSPEEVYPSQWEVFLDSVYLDGEELPDTALTPSSIGISALIDSGTTYILGPADVVKAIQDRIGNGGKYDCAKPHTLAFKIGGKIFPVDPRDFFFSADGLLKECTQMVDVKGTPTEGDADQVSWILGDSFLKRWVRLYFPNASFVDSLYPAY